MKKFMLGLAVFVMAVANETIISAIVLCILLGSFLAYILKQAENHHN